MKNTKNKTLSIKIINFILFLAILINSLAFFVFKNLTDYHVIFFIINLFLLFLYALSINIYEKDILKGLKFMKMLNNSSVNIFEKNNANLLLGDELKFSENRSFFNHFKYSIINNNLLKKDYADLEKVLLKFTPKSFLKDIGKKGRERIELGMSLEKNLNIMFLDIIGFTRISEKMSPERSLKLLNIYFDGIVEIVKKNGGYVDKFLGDGMMIIFGGMYSDKIIKAAIEIEIYIYNLNFNGENKKISIGIGINSGNVIVGTIGSKNRMEITVIGDVVNIASKLEGLTRKFKYQILITEDTYKKIKNKSLYQIDELGYKNIKGRKNKIKIYGVNI